MHRDDLTRRWFLARLTASGGAGLLTVSHSSMSLALDTQLAVTPHCLDDEPNSGPNRGPLLYAPIPRKTGSTGEPGDELSPSFLAEPVATRSASAPSVPRLGGPLARRHNRYVRQRRISISRPPIYRCRGAFPLRHHRAGPLSRTDASLSREIPGSSPAVTTQHYFPDELKRQRRHFQPAAAAQDCSTTRYDGQLRHGSRSSLIYGL